MRYDSDDDHETQEGTSQEGTYIIRRTEEYDDLSSDESEDPNPHTP